MSGLILCRTREAENPYYISNMDLKIYSLEELCYYIYNNIYLIGIDLVDNKLVAFIRYEIKEAELADKLDYFIKEKAGLAEIVITILKYVDYYNLSEIEELREILLTLDTQNVLERLKARADGFLENRCYFSAMKNYSNIINSDKDNTLPGIFYAKVYHNMGVSYANLYLFKKSIEYFNEAYKIGQHEESLKCRMVAEKLALGNEFKDTNDSNEDSEEVYVLNREIETLMDNATYSEEYKELEHIHSLKNDGHISESYKAIDVILDEWKRQYTKFTT